MPAAVLPNEGLASQLSDLLGRLLSAPLPWEVWLFVGGLVPAPTTVLSDLVEPTFLGYSRVTIQRTAWGVPVVAGGCAHSIHALSPYTWTATGGPSDEITGYAIVDPFAGKIKKAQRFEDADIFTIAPGGQYHLPIEYTLNSGEC